MVKELKINDTVYARYEIEYDVLYLKTYIYFDNEQRPESENCLAMIISSIEKTEFSRMAYLNIIY